MSYAPSISPDLAQFRDKDTVFAAVVDYFSSCLRAEALFGGGSLSSDAGNRLRVDFGSLLAALLADDTAAALDEQLKKEHNRLKNKDAKRARRETESTDARNARLDTDRASKKKSRRAAAAAALASTVQSDSTYDAAWPQILAKDFSDRCCEDYAAAMDYKPPRSCCCCSRARLDAKITELDLNPESPDLALLLPLQMPSGDLWALFVFPSFLSLDRFMLESLGCVSRSRNIVLDFCEDYRGSLRRHKMPCFALANNLSVARS
ncbi:hypothetical protein FRC00_005642 [Tulasnella sp. 408]|nr:hypothetical protein FRC00_005642 [Tulasnella sp. 408]